MMILIINMIYDQSSFFLSHPLRQVFLEHSCSRGYIISVLTYNVDNYGAEKAKIENIFIYLSFLDVIIRQEIFGMFKIFRKTLAVFL